MSGFSRREFMVRSGTVVLGFGAGGTFSLACQDPASLETEQPPDPDGVPTDSDRDPYAASTGYILVDTLKCQGCASCMFACSLVHEGVENLSLSRIQVIQNAFALWSDALSVEQCRQCVTPMCVEACQYNAAHVAEDYGNIRAVNESNCVGCGACFEACPHSPRRVIVVADEGPTGAATSQKCDLCAHAPYHWHEEGGGPAGKQACVEVCPVKAIAFSADVPVQTGDSGYKVDLRDNNWAVLGYPKD